MEFRALLMEYRALLSPLLAISAVARTPLSLMIAHNTVVTVFVFTPYVLAAAGFAMAPLLLVLMPLQTQSLHRCCSCECSQIWLGRSLCNGSAVAGACRCRCRRILCTGSAYACARRWRCRRSPCTGSLCACARRCCCRRNLYTGSAVAGARTCRCRRIPCTGSAYACACIWHCRRIPCNGPAGAGAVQMLLPPHCLHWRLMRWCLQMPLPPQSLHTYLMRPCSNLFIRFPPPRSRCCSACKCSAGSRVCRLQTAAASQLATATASNTAHIRIPPPLCGHCIPGVTSRRSSTSCRLYPA